MVEEKIKSMKLYNFIDRVYNELKELGKEIEGDLSIDELSSQYGRQVFSFLL